MCSSRRYWYHASDVDAPLALIIHISFCFFLSPSVSFCFRLFTSTFLPFSSIAGSSTFLFMSSQWSHSGHGTYFPLFQAGNSRNWNQILFPDQNLFHPLRNRVVDGGEGDATHPDGRESTRFVAHTRGSLLYHAPFWLGGGGYKGGGTRCSLTLLFTHSLPQSLTHLNTHSLTHLNTHSLTHLNTQALTHSLTLTIQRETWREHGDHHFDPANRHILCP